MIKTLLVDNEQFAREELRRLLSDQAEFRVVGEARNIDEAARAIERLAPDLLLLDAAMPGGSGFDLLERLEVVPQVIFTTAHGEFGAQTLELQAVDYLLKPFEEDRLQQALDRVERPPKRRRDALGAEDRIFVRDGTRCRLVRLGDVVVLESEANDTRLVLDDQRPLIRRSLKLLDGLLDRQLFFRANRRQIVNLSRINDISTRTQGRKVAVLEGGHEVELSPRRAADLQERLSL